MTRNEWLSSFQQWFRRASPTLTSTLGGVAAGVVLVISCNMGPSISMADGTTGGDTSGGTTGGSAGGNTSGGSTGGGSGGSCDCSFSGPVTLAGPITVAGPITNTPASENSGQLLSGQVPATPSIPPGAVDCTAFVLGSALKSMGGTASCIKLADGPFVLTDLFTTPTGNWGVFATTWLFAAPPSANWDASTQPQWYLSQPIAQNQTQPDVYTGMRYVVPAGSSLYAVSDYVQGGASGPTPVSFSWAGFKLYQ